MLQESEPARESKQMPYLIKIHLKLASHIREEVKITSDKAAQKLVKQSAIKNPPNVYDVGAEVLVRRFSSNSRRKADKHSRIVAGRITKRNVKLGTYKVMYKLCGKEVQIKVTDITSLTHDEDKSHDLKICNTIMVLQR